MVAVITRLGIVDWVIGDKVGEFREQRHNIKRGRKTNKLGRVRQQFEYGERKDGVII